MTLSVAVEPAPLRVDGEGVIRVGTTRVTLDTVVAAFLEGASAEEIVSQYPSLDLADVYAVIGHYLRHRVEVEAYLAKRSEQEQTVRLENEKRFPPVGLRAQLLARRHQPPQ